MSFSIPRFGHRHHLRVGLLGGSFNPAHEGHLHVARQAIIHAGLDQLWLMVSPGNPLKSANGMAPFANRLASAARIADGRRIIATDIERQFGLHYTAATMEALKRRFPAVKFVWLMGADNLRQLPRWGNWLRIMRAMPMLSCPARAPRAQRLPAKRLRVLRNIAFRRALGYVWPRQRRPLGFCSR